MGAQRIGISSDDVATQAAFASENNLDFVLLSDPEQVVARQFGVKRLGSTLDKRLTFVIDTDRTLAAIISSKADMREHAEEALRFLQDRSAD